MIFHQRVLNDSKYILQRCIFELYYPINDDPYKIDLIERMDEDNNIISCYTQGDFTDLCRGPHVESVKELKHFKLLKVSGAYWKNDSKNHMLQRIYGVCFETEEDLNEYLNELEERKQRDHRKIGKDLDIFMSNDLVGKGMPMWLPNGALIRKQLENYIYEKEQKLGYQHVYTPCVGTVDLYKTSGHWDHYKENMFPMMKVDEEEFVLRPMNCPHHMLIYANHLHSYRELPIRIGEFATDFRYESHNIYAGKNKLNNLPATYVEDENEAMTLELTLVDSLKNVKLILSYSVFEEFDAITRSVKSQQNSEKNLLPALPMYFSITSPMDLPSFLTDAYRTSPICLIRNPAL